MAAQADEDGENRQPVEDGGRAGALAQLRRVKANLDAARAIDRNVPHPRIENAAVWKKRVEELRADLTPDQGDQNPGDPEGGIFAHAELAILFGMLGDDKARANELAAIGRIAERETLEPRQRWEPIKAFFSAGEIDAALALEARYGRAAELDKYLRLCGRYDDAEKALRKLADDGTAAEPDDLVFLANNMLGLGDRARAERSPPERRRSIARWELPPESFYSRDCALQETGLGREGGRVCSCARQPPEGRSRIQESAHFRRREFLQGRPQDLALKILDEMLIWPRPTRKPFTASLCPNSERIV